MLMGWLAFLEFGIFAATLTSLAICGTFPVSAVHEDPFDDADAVMTSEVMARVQKVLAKGDVSVQEYASDSLTFGGKAFTAFQSHSGFGQSVQLLSEAEQLLKTLGEAQKSGNRGYGKAADAIKKYAPKAKKHKKLGKFAMLQQLSKEKALNTENIQEALAEAAEQKELLEGQLTRQARTAGVYAAYQLAESSMRCHSVVSAYLEHKEKLPEWQLAMNDWKDELNLNRKHLQAVIDEYKHTKEWDIASLASISWRANDVHQHVETFNADLLKWKKEASSHRFDAGIGLLSNAVNGALNLMQAANSPMNAWSIFAGGAHVTAAAVDVASAVSAHLDLNLLNETLAVGKELLMESTKQVEVLKKGRKSILRSTVQNLEARRAEGHLTHPEL